MSMGKLRRATDIKELRRDFDSIRSTVAGDTRFGAQAIMFIAEKLDALTRAAPKREPTAWQRFFAAGMKAGKTPAEIGAEWRARRAAGNRSSGSENGVKVVKDGVSVTDKEPGQ